MFKKIFKRTFLLSGIFLLSTFMLVQLSWGCDHHDKWDCDDHGKYCHPPKIQIVYLEYKVDSIVFEIWGKNFDNGVTPVVTLGGIFDLTVDEASTDDNVITATLSSIKGKNFEFGDYRLVVSACHDSACKNKYFKDHGPNCKCKYCKDYECRCRCRCKDQYSLTIAGPPGPPGPPGAIDSAVYEKVGDFDNITSPKTISGIATCGDGYTVTGGGFKQINLKIIESRPEGNGWYALGKIVAPLEIEADPTLTIYAVCAKIK